MSLLTAYSWPGNVRELEHVVNAMVAAAASSPMTVRQLPQQFMQSLATEMQLQSTTPKPDGPSLRIDIPLETELVIAENQFLKAFIASLTFTTASIGSHPLGISYIFPGGTTGCGSRAAISKAPQMSLMSI